MELQFILTTAEANVIIKALAEMPYKDVHELIVKLQVQAQPQLSKQQPSTGAAIENMTGPAI